MTKSCLQFIAAQERFHRASFSPARLPRMEISKATKRKNTTIIRLDTDAICNHQPRCNNNISTIVNSDYSERVLQTRVFYLFFFFIIIPKFRKYLANTHIYLRGIFKAIIINSRNNSWNKVVLSVEHFERAQVRTGLVSRGEGDTRWDCSIFAWSYKGIYAFRGERHGSTINAALYLESVLYIQQGRGFRRKKKRYFSFVIYRENIFLFRAFFFVSTTHTWLP